MNEPGGEQAKVSPNITSLLRKAREDKAQPGVNTIKDKPKGVEFLKKAKNINQSEERQPLSSVLLNVDGYKTPDGVKAPEPVVVNVPPEEVPSLNLVVTDMQDIGRLGTIRLTIDIAYLEGLLERSTFPDDTAYTEARQKMKESSLPNGTFGDHEIWRAEVVDTTRGNLEWRLQQLREAQEKIIQAAQANKDDPRGVDNDRF